MEYFEAANFLLDLRRFRMKPGTDSTRRLLGFLDDPHRGPKYVQIAGSNGKGSTARIVDSILREAGYDVGLYTSPHIDEVRERIRVNDRPIAKAAVVEFIEEIEDYVKDQATENDSPTFFEVSTAMAFWHFGQCNVDVAVIEVGIGGKFDATSVIDPVASAVTSVSLEHTAVLGKSVEEIARDKAHVAPADAPLVTAATGPALSAIKEIVSDVVVVGDGSRDSDVSVQYNGVENAAESSLTITGDGWRVEGYLALLGEHQARNAAVAAALVRQFTPVDSDQIARGLRTAHWPGRFEIMERDPLVILDGAHNPGAFEALVAVLAEFDFEELHVVFGAMHDKAHREMVDLLPTPATVFTCEPNLDRAADHDVLARVFERAGAESVVAMTTVETAVTRAIDAASSGDCVLVTGSLYTVGEARRRWSRLSIPKRIRDLQDATSTLQGAHVTPAGTWRMRAKGVHRVRKLRVVPRQARILKEELLSLGGECALSGLQGQDEELIDVVLLGTLAQYKRLIEKLVNQPYGLSAIGRDLQSSLGIGVDPVRPGFLAEDRTAVMGILNVTPDSFHDGSAYETYDAAVARATEMAAQGADIVDVGGESTRPGAEPVGVDEELARVIPVIEEVAKLDIDVSVDTRKATVARAAVDAGVDIINDVSGLADPEMRFVAADNDVPVIVMHSIETPVDPERSVTYDDVVEDVIAELRERVLLAEKAGIERDQIIIDPGLGFGKSPAECFEILGRLNEFKAFGCPVLVGHSHKSMFGVLGYNADNRRDVTVAGTALAASQGADIVRVHDVRENVGAVKAADMITDMRRSGKTGTR